MTPAAYTAALRAAGVPADLPLLEQDRHAARLLRLDARTTRRYRSGDAKIPGPVQVALHCLASRRKENA